MLKNIIALILTISAANAAVYRNNLYDPDTFIKVNHDTQRVQITNYMTGQMQDVKVRPGSQNWDIDMQTGKMFYINVDSKGNTRIWEPR